MSRNDHRESAEIIQFPHCGRRGLSPRPAHVAKSVPAKSERTASVAATSAWYHEAAVDEAEALKH